MSEIEPSQITIIIFAILYLVEVFGNLKLKKMTKEFKENIND